MEKGRFCVLWLGWNRKQILNSENYCWSPERSGCGLKELYFYIPHSHHLLRNNNVGVNNCNHIKMAAITFCLCQAACFVYFMSILTTAQQQELAFSCNHWNKIRDVKWLDQGHWASKWWGLLVSKICAWVTVRSHLLVFSHLHSTSIYLSMCQAFFLMLER